MEWVTLVTGILEGLLSIAATATTGQAANIIGMLERIIGAVAGTVPQLLPSIQNIITALSNNGNVTADQIAQLQTQSAQVDAALDAAAQADGL